MSLAFVPGFPSNSPRFLGRFLSPVADGVAAHYVHGHTRRGDLVLDPFGQSPSVAAEALSLDRRVVVACSNPILRLALSLAVRPPALTELKLALTALGDVRVGPSPNDRLEVLVKGFYKTTCAECQTPTTADAYDWDSEVGEPVTKRYVCLKCGGPREAPTDAADRGLALRFGRSGPDYYFLLGRSVAPDDSERGQADDTLAVYPPRTLAAIAVVLHKLEGLDLGLETRRLLDGLLVAALDATTALGQDRPKVLSVPRHYRELNVWLALESALGLLAGPAAPHRLVTLDDLLSNPTRAAIYAHPGPMRDLEPRLPAAAFSLGLTAVPRPNQAFWTLSATWAAWLWGPEANEAFRGSVHRRRYDWNWHARALHQSLAAAQPALAPGGRLVGLLAEAEPGFNASLLSAAGGAGYHLRAWSLRGDTAEAQLEFEPNLPAVQPAGAPDLTHAVREAAVALLLTRGEPSRWTSLHFAAWCGITAKRLADWDAGDPLARVNQALQQAAADKSTFLHWSESSGDDPASGLWFLADEAVAAAKAGPARAASRPLADRVEAEVLRRLGDGKPVDEYDLLREVYAVFPGALTPGRALVLACLASYGLKGEAGLWQLRPEDTRETRSGEVQSIQAALRALATRNGFSVADANPQEWREGDETVYSFAVVSSAVVSHYLLPPWRPARRRFLVLPGGRAGLVEHKLRRDPRLRQALLAGAWTIVKFRRVRQMLADVGVTRATLEPALAGDPLQSLQQLALPEGSDK